MSQADNASLARRHVEELWNKQNFDVIDELYSDDFEIRSLWPNPLLPGGVGDREGAKEAAKRWLGVFPDMQLSFDHVVADDEKVVTVHTCTATDTVGFMGYPATNKSFSITGILVHQMNGGKITRLWTMFDLFAIMLKLGHVTPPAAAGARS